MNPENKNLEEFSNKPSTTQPVSFQQPASGQPDPVFPDPVMNYGGKKKFFVKIIVLFVILAIIIAGAATVFLSKNNSGSILNNVEYRNEKSESYSLDFFGNSKIVKASDLGIIGLQEPQNESQDAAQKRSIIIAPIENKDKFITLHVQKSNDDKNILLSMEACLSYQPIKTKKVGYDGPICPLSFNQASNPTVQIYMFESTGVWYTVTITQDFSKQYIEEAKNSPENAHDVMNGDGLEIYKVEIEKIVTSIRPL